MTAKMLCLIIFLIACSSLCVAQQASATSDGEPPFTFQGKLDVGGVPANRPYDFIVRLYREPEAAPTSPPSLQLSEPEVCRIDKAPPSEILLSNFLFLGIFIAPEQYR